MVPVFTMIADAQTREYLHRAFFDYGTPIHFDDNDALLSRLVAVRNTYADPSAGPIVLVQCEDEASPGVALLGLLRDQLCGENLRVGLIVTGSATTPLLMLASRFDATAVLGGEVHENSARRFAAAFSGKTQNFDDEPTRTRNATDATQRAVAYSDAVAYAEPNSLSDDARVTRPVDDWSNYSQETVLINDEELYEDPAAFDEATSIQHTVRKLRAELVSASAPSKTSSKSSNVRTALPPLTEGSLDREPFPELLSRAAQLRITGGIVCLGVVSSRPTTNGEAPSKIVYFRAGVPVDAESNIADESLSALLLRQRKLSKAALSAAHDVERVRAVSPAEAISRLRLLSPSSLAEAMAEQLRLKILDLFSWRMGSYVFAPGIEPPKGNANLPYSFAELMLDGVRSATPSSFLSEYGARVTGQYVVVDTSVLGRIARLELGAQAHAVLDRVGQGMLCEHFIEAVAGRPRGRLGIEVLYTLVCLGVFRIAPEPDVPTTALESPRANFFGDEIPTVQVESEPATVAMEIASIQRAPPQTMTTEDLPILPQHMHTLGLNALREGNWREAQALFESTVTDDATRSDAAAYAELCRFAVATPAQRAPHLRALETLSRRHPMSASVAFARACAYRMSGDFASATVWVRTALGLDPRHEDAVQLLRVLVAQR